ncbi:hypothetical protein [Streptomyces nigra]|uniref:hypothetical protein n=1 Tax=Streptomyces nigra TaxID=1827580 RepID=UPI0013DDA8C8|nr:hypothetical protein [Streptomyces nigra]
MLTVISRSYEVASSEPAERMYDGLTASGDHLVVVFAYDGMPIAADFGIGDDW